jgi:hypothetical protein
MMIDLVLHNTCMECEEKEGRDDIRFPSPRRSDVGYTFQLTREARRVALFPDEMS